MRPGGQASQGIGIDDDDALIGQVLAAADQRPDALVIRLGVEHFVAGQRRGVERADDRRPVDVSARDDQRSLGQAETGIEGLATEAARLEGLGEGVERFGPHRFGAVEGHAPSAQIEGFSLFGRDFANAQIVGEVRAAAGAGLEAADRRQPTVRLLQEAHRRHQHVGTPDVERLQNAADQAHVVIARQPEHALAATSMLERMRDQGTSCEPGWHGSAPRPWACRSSPTCIAGTPACRRGRRAWSTAAPSRAEPGTWATR